MRNNILALRGNEHSYQQAHPELQDKFAKHDLFAPGSRCLA